MAAVSPEQQLAELRSTIDNIDAALVHMLAERFKATQRVGRLKAEHEMPASDPDREARQIARLRRLAEESHLDPEFAEKWFNFVVAEVIHHHTRIAEESRED
ncbi:chorismate mutase [Leucobacter sp. CSA1]|uniref:Chorismate mutase n=1 Tax=Leucobacter chromiisoli TaxID=2796471 RepID=A0A934Q2N1_9MICO|nr:chorismate mutase [Leucobacter chromiisoli]MBK0417435.1 chorismate mutase [Leucobacter chromiisoli]